MELVEIKCGNCGREIYVRQGCIREKMFCTLGCLESSIKDPKPIKVS